MKNRRKSKRRNKRSLTIKASSRSRSRWAKRVVKATQTRSSMAKFKKATSNCLEQFKNRKRARMATRAKARVAA